jgi:mono/diheme cytochrome c family protein
MVTWDVAAVPGEFESLHRSHARAWRVHPRPVFGVSAQKGVDHRDKPGRDGAGNRFNMTRNGFSFAGAQRPMAPAVLLLAALAIAAAVPHAFAQGPSLRPPAFTEEQVQRGKSIYQKNCQDCHGSTLDNGEFGGAPLKGAYFRQHWGSGDVSALFGYVNTLMPPDRPGQLSEQSYVDLTAFLLSSNGYAAGPEALTADQDTQRNMTMKR